jgi:adenylate cyclase
MPARHIRQGEFFIDNAAGAAVRQLGVPLRYGVSCGDMLALWRFGWGRGMSETRKLAAILVTDVVGYSRLAGADEDRILARLGPCRSDVIDPTVAVQHGRIVKRTGGGGITGFRSVVDAVRCAIEVQNGMAERNAGPQEDRRIEFRVGVHLGEVVEDENGNLIGAARVPEQ